MTPTTSSRCAVTTAIAALASSAFTAGAAHAAGNLLLLDKPPAQTTIAAGPSVWVLPTYPGARGTRTTVLPGVDVATPGGLFLSTDTGAGWNMSKSDDWQAGIRLWPQFGRSRHHTPAGVDSIGTRLQAELFANLQVLPVLLLQSGLLHGAGRHHDGDQLELGLTSGLPLGGGDLLGIGLSTTYANRAYRQSYFGISAQESVASGLAAAELAGGWNDAALTFSAEHKFSAQWKLSGQLIAARLLGGAARSPLTQSRSQTMATATLWYQF